MAFPARLRPCSVASVALTSALALGSGVGLLLEFKATQAQPLGAVTAPTRQEDVEIQARPGCSRTKGGWSCSSESANACALSKGGWTC